MASEAISPISASSELGFWEFPANRPKIFGGGGEGTKTDWRTAPSAIFIQYCGELAKAAV
jgi:hypothetical protein